MKFKVNKGPFLRDKRSTTSIMLELFAVLFVIFAVSVAFYSTKYNLMAGLRVLSIGLISIVTTLIIDVIVGLIKGKRKIKDLFKFVLKSYSYVTALIFALCLPAGTSFYVVVVGAIIATVIGKYVFGGFGNNIFNPAIIGRIFVGLCFPDKLQTIKVVDNNSIDIVSGSTLTGSIDWNTGVSSFTGNDKVSLLQTLFGEYQGAIGETFTALLVVAAIYLIIRGIINYRLTMSYVVTTTLCILGFGLLNKVENIGEYLLTGLSTGGLMFAAVFMITDPVTSPKSQDGKIIYASVAGFLTVFIRTFSSYPEGVMFSIALANMVTPLIDSAIKGNTFDKLPSRITKLTLIPIVALLLIVGYGSIPFDRDSEGGLPKTSEGGSGKKDTGIVKITDSFYEITKDGYHGEIKLFVRVDRFANKITSIDAIVPSGERYSKWLDPIGGYIGEDLDIDFADLDDFTCEAVCIKTGNATDLDITSGATISSSVVITGLKDLVNEINQEGTSIVEKTTHGYIVTVEGVHGDIEVTFVIENEVIKSATVIASPDECDHNGIESLEKYNYWFGNNNISFDEIDSIEYQNGAYVQTNGDSDLDISTGSTVTSYAVIKAFKEAVDASRGEA